jgi:hypothetical protein
VSARGRIVSVLARLEAQAAARSGAALVAAQCILDREATMREHLESLAEARHWAALRRGLERRDAKIAPPQSTAWRS